ncbi:unnamed protein product [Cochlearia groenlandica]
METIKNDDVINPTANWLIAGGDLTDSVSFESSFTTTTGNHESDDGIIPAAKSPLILLPPAPNGEPCEITITFEQAHELRQVYIRSTAKVYEVYYTKKLGHDREYLCTVRCGIAMRAEEVLQIPLIESAASESPVKDVSMERKVKDNGGNGRTNEDDWVEVKSGDASLMINDKDMLSMPQDFFEATAEINDAEPCISITLRLLSLQDKRCALVNEVYIFADPIDQSEIEQEEASKTGNSSSSALMAMFMPTILQLSRGKYVRKEQDRQISENSNNKNPGTLGISGDFGKTVNTLHQEKDFSSADYKGASLPVIANTLANHVDATRVSEAETKPGMSCNNVETMLHQLVNKVSRIETILTSFEEQMLKPISSIDARLQLVEKKLEQLSKKSFESELLVEPNKIKSDSMRSDTAKSIETDELDGLSKNTDNPCLPSYTDTEVPDSSCIDKSGDYAVVQSKNSISESEMISAESEISTEEVVHSLGRVSFEEKPKRSLSVNDALASALAGLLSSTSLTDRKYSQALVVTAPEFSNEDDTDTEEKPQTDSHSDNSQVSVEDLGNTKSASESSTYSQKEPEVTLCIDDDYQETISEVPDTLDDSMGRYYDAETVVSVMSHDSDKETLTSSTQAGYYKNHDSLDLKECKGESERDDVLKSVVGFQTPTSPIDFLTPVLDVKFNSWGKVSDNRSLFEALYSEESQTVVGCNDEALGDDDNLVSMEEEELKGPPTDTLSSLGMDHYEVDNNELHLHVNVEEITTASLI